MAIEINARKREAQGTGASRRLRRSGRVPGIVYGGDKDAVRIDLDHKDLFFNLRNEKFHASILTLALDGEKQQVLLRAVNMHPFKAQVQHIDFQRISKDKKIHMKVPLHFVNAEKSPGVKEQAGVVNHVMTELDIACFPDDLPEYVEVDLSGLTVGHSLHVRQLPMPKGVELALSKDEDPVVATVVVPALVSEEEEAAAAAAAVAPSEVPTTEQAAPAKEGEGAPAEGGKGGAAAAPAAKGGAAAAAKGAEKPAEKKEKK
ncbi:MAG TPA: 50S ribosomal protein L25/general stress protein Ctc [Burkholderiales bacterium]|nr:50S ribosomal protein L25/general stress protein Ctc [Burkholderiales bacterium]